MKVANCKNCNKEFEYKWTGRGNSCSKECTAAIVAKSKLKYTDEQIHLVIALKKEGKTNTDIVSLSGVKLSKVKEIVKANNVLLAPEERQKHAYEAKLAKDPLAMEKMRYAYHEKTSSPDALEYIKTTLLERGFEYVSGFQSKTKSFVIKCLACKNIRETSKIHTVIKNSCQSCNGCNRTSGPEIEIKEWIKGLGLKVEKYKFKNRIGGSEIDIYMPELKIGIEYCGLYWHNENSPTPREEGYHHYKMVKAANDGIRLITIFGDEWFERNSQVKNFLLSVLHKNPVKIMGRKTKIDIISKEKTRDFLDLYHIQGASSSKIAFGLHYNEELVGVITGDKHHRGGTDNVLVLNRLAFKDGVSVSGGSSKLLKALLDYAKLNGYNSVISWSDNRWSVGNVYNKTGFIMEEELRPDYSYVFRSNRISKQSCQKKHLLEKGGIGETEREMAQSLGYARIWDCGKKRWSFKL